MKRTHSTLKGTTHRMMKTTEYGLPFVEELTATIKKQLQPVYYELVNDVKTHYDHKNMLITFTCDNLIIYTMNESDMDTYACDSKTCVKDDKVNRYRHELKHFRYTRDMTAQLETKTIKHGECDVFFRSGGDYVCKWDNGTEIYGDNLYKADFTDTGFRCRMFNGGDNVYTFV